MVDFTREPDKPMQDLTSLLEKTNERRKEEIQQVFSDKPFLTQEKDPILERMERTLQKHSEMLLSILETQMKLIDYLQRNKK
jgi:hypothetical protein